MAAMRRTFSVLVTVMTSLTGCAANKGLSPSHSGAGVSAYSFWPPPPSTWLWISADSGPVKRKTLAAAADDLATELRAAGSTQQRWFPIGLGFAHGFAVTTRLEQVDSAGNPSQTERWSPLHGGPADLRWLSLARAVRSPRPGRYRVFLLAVTDLPVGGSTTAPVWNEQTVMAGPSIPLDFDQGDVPRALRLSSAHRLSVYVYVYERHAGQDRAELVLLPDEREPPGALLQPFGKRAAIEPE